MVLERNTPRNIIATDTQKTAQQTWQKNTDFVAHSCVEINPILAAECNPETPDVYPKKVTCYTPAGEPMQVMAKDAAHGQFLITKNPKPTAAAKAQAVVRATSCRMGYATGAKHLAIATNTRDYTMIDALISGKLIKQPELKTSQNGKPYTNFLLSVSIGEAENTVISGVAFGDKAERIAKLGKGDAVSAIGALKPTEWQDKATNETKHGLSVTVSDVLTVYNIKKRRQNGTTNTKINHLPVMGSHTQGHTMTQYRFNVGA